MRGREKGNGDEHRSSPPPRFNPLCCYAAERLQNLLCRQYSDPPARCQLTARAPMQVKTPSCMHSEIEITIQNGTYAAGSELILTPSNHTFTATVPSATQIEALMARLLTYKRKKIILKGTNRWMKPKIHSSIHALSAQIIIFLLYFLLSLSCPRKNAPSSQQHNQTTNCRAGIRTLSVVE